MKARLLILKVLVVVCVLFAYVGHEQLSWSKNNEDLGAGHHPVFMPELDSISVKIDDDDVLPMEPNLAKTRFFKYPPVTSLSERVDRLIYGIETDVRPELDHYGYEIRRYMAHVGNVKVFSNNEFLDTQLSNTKKARIISDYWKKHVEKEILDIESVIDADNSVDLRVRTVFKQNKITSQTFLISLKSWIDSNERLLTHIHKSPDTYEVMYPEVLVVVPATRVDFYNFYAIRQTKLKDIQKYQPFALMVY